MRPNTHRCRAVQCHNIFGVSLAPYLVIPRIGEARCSIQKCYWSFWLIALVIFGTKRLRSIGSDLGAAVKGFKQAMNDGETEEDAEAAQARQGRGLRPPARAPRESRRQGTPENQRLMPHA